MIVIPTKNGYWHLKKLLDSFLVNGTNNHKILIVDNGTDNIVSKKFLDSVVNEYSSLDLTIEKNKHASYETGAIIHAVREYPNEERFIMLHDSCETTSKHWLTQFEEKLTPEVGAVTWIRFKPCLFAVYPFHFEYMHTICPTDNVPEGGFFGSIFYTYGSILREFDQKGYFNNPPTQKIHSEAWERIWAILYHINGYGSKSIIDGFNPNAIHFGGYPHLRKTFAGRG